MREDIPRILRGGGRAGAGCHRPTGDCGCARSLLVKFDTRSIHRAYSGSRVRVTSYQLNNEAPTADDAARKSCVHLSVHLYALTELSSFFFFASAIKGFRCSGMSTLGGILTGRMRTLTNSA